MIDILIILSVVLAFGITIYNVIRLPTGEGTRNNDYLESFLKNGFSDITDIRPIKLFDLFFGPKMYSFSHRLYRKTNNIVTEVIIGEENGCINMICSSYDINSDKQIIMNNINIPQKSYKPYLITFVDNNEKQLSKLIKNERN